MSIRARINTTLQLNITITTGGAAESLEGRDITVFLKDPQGELTEIEDWTLTGDDDNVITFTYEGAAQQYTGGYQVIVYENYESDTMESLDIVAFTLVPRSSLVNYDDSDDTVTPEIDLDGNLSIRGAQGLSAYEVAVANGYEGTEAEWLESLKAYEFDTTPTEGSTNPVTSGGIYTKITESLDNLVSEGSTTYNNY